jgi:ABC-type Fe3+-hydroxamate transport system substrate-binding protein
LIIANKEENDKEQIEALAREYNILVTDVANLESALKMIKDIGVITETYATAEKLADQIKTGFQNFPPLQKTIRACYLIWKEPYMTIGSDTFIHDMLSKCGFENIYSHKNRYPVLEIKELADSHCELLILSSEPYPFKQKHILELQKQLPDTKIVLADGEMFSWYGSRLLKAVSYFESLLTSISNDFKHN